MSDSDLALAGRLAGAPANLPIADLLFDAAPSSVERVIDLLLAQADDQTRNDPVRSLHLARRALDLSSYGASGDLTIQAACLRMLGHAHRALGHHTQCLDLYDQAAHLYRTARLPLEATRTRLGAVTALMYLGRTAEALALGRRMRRIFARHGASLEAAKLEANLAIIHARLHRPRRALALADSAAASFAALDEELLLAQINVNRANMLTDIGAFRPALDAYTAARAAFAARDMRSWTAKIDVNVGYLYAAQGHYNQALRAFSTAGQVFAALDSPRDLAAANLDLAELYLALNLDAEAVTLAAGAAATFAAEGMTHDMARALLMQAQALAAGNDEPGEALSLLEQASATFADEEYAVGVAMIRLHQAALLMETDPGAALHHVMAAEPVLAQHELAAQHGQSLLLKALAHEKLGERRSAYAGFRRAARIADRYGLPWLLAQARHGDGRLRERHDPEGARRAYEAAIEATESMRAELQPDEMRISFVHGRLGPYEDMLRLLLRTNDGRHREEAFALVERARARALLDMLAGNLDVAGDPGTTATDGVRVDLRGRIRQLREELNWQLSVVHDWSDDAHQRRTRLGRREALHTARALEEELHGLIRQWRVLEPADATLGVASVFDVADVQAHLASGQALLEYTIVDDEVLAFVIARDTVTLVRRICSASAVGRLIDRLYAGLQRFSYGEEWAGRHGAELQKTADSHLERLGAALLAPLAGVLAGYDRLVIAPHGPLHYVPFHALRGPGGDLLDTHEISVIPSASVWVVCRERMQAAAPPTQGALVLGVDDSQTPWMAHEAESVGRLFAGARVFTGPEASLATVHRESARCDMLHLACHGVFRSDDPLFSALRLADGWLTVHDIYNLHLHARLVTLSGCQTGQQSIGPGDDLIGLARGFFSAGASQLVVSLWMVNDASTSVFMEHFYAALSAGQGAAAALRTAHRISRDRYHHPYYWAPFVLIGAG